MRGHRYLWALGAVLLASCYDYSVPDSVVNGAVVATQENPTFPYATTTHYYLDPNAQAVSDSGTTTVDLNTYQGGIYKSILTTIDSNMQAAGYTALPALPPQGTANTVGIKLTFLQGSVSVYYPGYWCDYWYYYNCYYTPSYVGSYNTGTMIIEMGDLSKTGTTTLPVAWLAAVYGVAGTATYNTTLAVGGINRAFGQSPYLFH